MAHRESHCGGGEQRITDCRCLIGGRHVECRSLRLPSGQRCRIIGERPVGKVISLHG
jgi:hypothetical protein